MGRIVLPGLQDVLPADYHRCVHIYSAFVTKSLPHTVFLGRAARGADLVTAMTAPSQVYLRSAGAIRLVHHVKAINIDLALVIGATNVQVLGARGRLSVPHAPVAHALVVDVQGGLVLVKGAVLLILGAKGEYHVVPGVGDEDGVSGGHGVPLAAGAEAKAHLAAHRLQGGVGAALAAVLAQDALHMGRGPAELKHIVSLAVLVLHLDLVHAAGADVEAHAALIQFVHAQIGFEQDEAAIQIHPSAAAEAVEEGIVPRLEAEVPRVPTGDTGAPGAVQIMLYVDQPRPARRVHRIHRILRPVHAPVADRRAAPTDVAPGLLVEVAVRVHRFALIQGVDPGGDGELAIAQVQAGAGIHAQVLISVEVRGSLAKDAVSAAGAGIPATLAVVAKARGIGKIGVLVYIAVLLFELQPENRPAVQGADLLRGQGPLEDTHVVNAAFEAPAA